MGAATTSLRIAVAATAVVGGMLLGGTASSSASPSGPLAGALTCLKGQAQVNGVVRAGEGKVAPASQCVKPPAKASLEALPATGWQLEAWKGCVSTDGNICIVDVPKLDTYTADAYFQDVSPPSTPDGLAVPGVEEASLTLTWRPSTDNAGVTGYDLFLNAAQVGSTDGTKHSFTGLKCATGYRLGVRAHDAAGNTSKTATASATTSPCTGDNTPPSTPTGLTVGSSSATTIALSWNASTDNVGVTGYDLLVDGAQVATVPATANTFAALTCGRSYTLGVRARDAAGNVSGVAAIPASTGPCAGDTTPPSTPSGLTVSPALTSLVLTWNASTDNVGVSGYDVFIDGAPAGGTAGTSHTFGPLACGTSHTLGVRARDAAGNVSDTATAPGSTAPCEGGGEAAPTIGDVGEPVGKDQLPLPSRNLLVSIGGTGTGTVRSTLLRRSLAVASRSDARPVRIVCGTAGFSCFSKAAPGAKVRLTATPAPGSRFASWTGACAGAGPTCVLSMSASRTVKALFARKSGSAVAVALQRLRFRIRWSASLGRGSLLVTGRVSRPSVLRLQLRRPGGGPLITQVAPVFAGRFRLSPKLAPGLLPPGALVLPGGFVVSLKGRSGSAALPLQLQTIVLPAPAEGVVRRAFASSAEDAPAALVLPAGTREAWASFLFEAQPRAGRKLTVRWYGPDGRLLGSVGKANRPRVKSFLRSEAGIPSGLWRAELRAGGRLVKVLGVRVG